MSLWFEYIFKYIIVGNSSVGKSSILLQFIDKKFNQTYDMTIGVEFGSKIIEVDDRLFKIQIWDTAGQEAFRSITRAYYRDAAAVLLVYDVSNLDSFQSLDLWLRDVILMTNNPQIILVGNKSDLDKEREITYAQGYEFAQKHGMIFIETSAKNRDNIDNIFFTVAKNIVKKIDDKHIDIQDMTYGIKLGIGRGAGIKIKELSHHDHSTIKCCHI